MERPFTVTAWLTDASKAQRRPEKYEKFTDAANHAWDLAEQQHIKSVAVTDLNGTLYAQFNMVWAIPEEFR